MLLQRLALYALLALVVCLVIPTWMLALLVGVALIYLFFGGPKLPRNT